MSQDVEHRIRERAYQIWQEQGCPEGSDHEHWFLAEQEVAAATPAKGNGGKAPARKAAPAKAAAGATPKPAAERKPRARKAAAPA